MGGVNFLVGYNKYYTLFATKFALICTGACLTNKTLPNTESITDTNMSFLLRFTDWQTSLPKRLLYQWHETKSRQQCWWTSNVWRTVDAMKFVFMLNIRGVWQTFPKAYFCSRFHEWGPKAEQSRGVLKRWCVTCVNSKVTWYDPYMHI